MKRQILICLGLCMISCSSPKEEGLKIACAANMEPAIDSIVTVFEIESNVKCDLVSSSTSVLAAQIEYGASFDIFISANQIIPNRLHDKGIVSKPELLANGALFLYYVKEHNARSEEGVLLAEDIDKIGVPNPDVAPFGEAAVDHLYNLGLFKHIDYKLVYAEDVSQVNHFLESGAVDAAYSSQAFLISNQEKYNYFQIQDSNLSAIEQTICTINSEKDQTEVKEFLEFLKTEKSSKILEYFGYSLPE